MFASREKIITLTTSENSEHKWNTEVETGCVSVSHCPCTIEARGVSYLIKRKYPGKTAFLIQSIIGCLEDSYPRCLFGRGGGGRCAMRASLAKYVRKKSKRVGRRVGKYVISRRCWYQQCWRAPLKKKAGRSILCNSSYFSSFVLWEAWRVGKLDLQISFRY